MTELKTYYVWDAGIRWFHWINLLCMLGLIAVRFNCQPVYGAD